METLKSDKLPPDDGASRKSTTNDMATSRSSVTRQSTPMPSIESAGQAKLSQTRRPRRKFETTPIEAVSYGSQRDNHLGEEKATGSVLKAKNLTEFVRTTHVTGSTESTESTGFKKGQFLESNGLSSTPKGTASEHCANDSPSLWLRKTPEEIVDFYRKLGPNWRK